MPSTLHIQPPEVARVKILGSQTIQRIEDELREIESLKPQRLLLPLDPKDRRLGGEAALMQLLITWGRQQPEAILKTYLTAGDPDTEVRMQKLAERPFGFVGLCFARDVTDQGGAR